jgi:hypothetical protein
MKNTLLFFLPASIIFILLSCSTGRQSTRSEKFPLPVPEQNSLMARWEKKPVSKTRLVDDMESGSGWEVTGIGEMSFTDDRSMDGSRSLRFRTSLRDEEHYRENRTEWGSFGGTQGGTSTVFRKFEQSQDWSGYNRLSFWVYVHPTTMRTYCLFLQMVNEGTVYNATYPGESHFIQDLKPGEWNHVMFEIPHLERSKVTELRINQMLTGHMPEDEGIVTYDIDKIELQRVDADQYEGWNVSPGKIAFSHAGYMPDDKKTAFAGEGAGEDFELLDQRNRVVFTGRVTGTETPNGRFRKLDFSDFRKPGVYRIRSGNLISGSFPLREDIWLDPIFSAINFFFCERCGFDVPGIHRECHKDWQGFRGEDKKIINGGWHDAGDLSQGAWRTSMAVYAMMSNLENLDGDMANADLASHIREELKWGLEWLLKTRFGDGYHMSFSVMRIYTDNQVGTIDDVVSPARNVPWENFLAAAVFCRAAMMLEESDPELAGRARTAAFEDWKAAYNSKENWSSADYREASWGATSSVLLGKMTGDVKYNDYAINFGDLVVGCQEQSFTDSIPITGYFYENTNRKKVIHNYHTSFEEAPMLALSMLCETFPENDNWMKWYSATVLYSEFFMKRGSVIAAPYGLLPNSVWKESELLDIKDSTVHSDMMRQFNDGTHLNRDYVLRTFPIYHDGLFHGNTNIQMSCTWALAAASRLRNDTAGMELAGSQLRWIFGTNPFGQSLMYGFGYNFAPQFAYCLKDVVGALPVGMNCMSGDMPYWSATNTATTKEIWVEPVNRFLGAASVMNAFDKNKTAGEKTDLLKIRAEAVNSENDNISVTLSLQGNGRHTIVIKTFNASADRERDSIDLGEGKTGQIRFDLSVPDKIKPYVTVFMDENNPGARCEVTGSFIPNNLMSLKTSGAKK